jgi:Heparinase II/III-like protein.
MRTGRKYLSLFLSLALLMAFVPTAAASDVMEVEAAYPSQVYSSLQNPGFENGDTIPLNWRLISGADMENGTFSLETNREGYVFRGAKALKLIYSGTGAYGVISDPVAVVPGQKYRLNLHSRTDAGSYKAIVDFYDGTGTIISGSSKEYAATGSGWKYVTTNGTSVLPAIAPENSSYATISLTVITGSTVYLDNIVFSELSMNRTLINGGFEEGMDQQTGEPAGYNAWEWGYGYYGTLDIAENNVHSGSKSLRVSTFKRQYSNNTVRTYLVSVIPGKDYNFSSWVFKESGAQPYMSVEYYDANGVSITAGRPANLNSTKTAIWELLSLNAVIPADVTFATITIWQAGAADAGVYYVDDISITGVLPDPNFPTGDAAIKNPSFEQGDTLPADWSKIGDTGTVVTVDNGDGTKSAKFTYVSGANGITSNYVAVESGKFYTVSAGFKNTTEQKPRIYLKFYSEAGTRISTVFWHGYDYLEMAPGGNYPLKVSGYILAPLGAKTAVLSIEQTAQTTGELLVDMVSLERAELSDTIINNGFENAQVNGIMYPMGWNAYSWTSGNVTSYDTLKVKNGNNSVKMDMTGVIDKRVKGALISSLVSVVPGETYEMSASIYNEGASKLALYCYWITQDGKQSLSKYPNSTKTGEWETVSSGKINAPSNAIAAAVMLYQSADVSYVDDVSITHVIKVVYADTLQNPGFEGGTNPDGTIKNWVKLSPSNNVVLSDEKKYEGMYSAKLTSENTDGNGLRSEPVKAVANQPYRAKIMLYNDIGTSEVYLEFWNESSNRISVKVEALSRTKEWKEVDVEAYAPENTVYATILIYQNSGVRGIVYADNGCIEKYTPIPEEIQEFVPVINGHPKVFFTESDIPGLKSKALDVEKAAMGSSGKEIAGKLLAQADVYLAEGQISYNFSNVYGMNNINITIPSPPVNVDVNNLSPNQPAGYGNYPFWTSISRGLEDRMESLSMAYILTDNEAYAQKAISIAMAMTTWAKWHDPKDTSVATNLDTAHTVFGISTVYDLLYNKMTEEERLKIKTALVGKGLEPLFADAKAKLDHNIQALRNSALGTGALALMGDVDANYTNKYLTRAMEYFNWYLEERRSSGNQEGFGYTAYAIENMIDTFEQFARVTGKKDLVNDRWLNEDLTKWVVSFSAPGSYTLAPVSDFDTATGFYQTFSVLANNGNGLAGWYLSKAKPGSQVLLTKQFLYLNKGIPISEPAQAIGNNTYLSSIGWGAIRTGWKSTDTLFGLIGNNTGLGHNHYDQNSFLISSNGQWLASDPGYSNFAYDKVWDFKSKVGHNTILVDWKKDTATGAQLYKGGGSIDTKVLTLNYAYMVGSAANAYGSLLNRFDRHAVMVNHKEQPYYILFDDLSSSQERTYTWSLFTGNWDNLLVNGSMINGSTSSQLGNTIEVRKGYNRLYAQFVSDDAMQIDTGIYSGTEGQYIHASNIVKATDQKFLTVLNTFATSICIPAAVFQPSAVMDEGTTGALSLESALFRGEKGIGGKVSWTFNVDKAGKYDISLVMPKSYIYGIYQASIDGVDLGAPYDGYSETVIMGNINNLGKMRLSAGEHTLTMTCTGTSVPSGDKFFTAVTNIVLSDTSVNTTIDKAVRITQKYDTDSILGAKIAYTSEKQDMVLFNRGTGTVSNDDMVMNAKNASVLGIQRNTFEGFGVTDATSLTYKRIVLLKSESAVSAAADYGDSKTSYFELNSSAVQNIKLYVPFKAKSITIDGQGVPFIQKNGLVEISVPSGRHSVVVQHFKQGHGSGDECD